MNADREQKPLTYNAYRNQIGISVARIQYKLLFKMIIMESVQCLFSLISRVNFKNGGLFVHIKTLYEAKPGQYFLMCGVIIN